MLVGILFHFVIDTYQYSFLKSRLFAAANNDNNTSHNANNKSMDSSAPGGPGSTHMHLDDDSGIYDIKPNINVMLCFTSRTFFASKL